MKQLCTLLTLLAACQFLPADAPVRERIEWIDIWITDADKDHLPRVLLVGDSITRGYFGSVEKQLAGKAYCARLTTSKCVTDPAFNDDLQLLMKQYKFSVIHFNNGLHGWGYTEEQYRAGLAKTVATVKEHSADAKFIWATTTPVRKKSDLQKFDERTERVKARNSLAADIMKQHSIPTNDLFNLVEGHSNWHSPDGVHFNGQGNEALAKQVATCILQNSSLAELP
ncbi:MAG: SGNH/GDSL hydrolase family protein [Fuerstiella sp.]